MLTEAQELAYWRDATGLTEPTTLPVGVTMTVGRCRVTTMTDRFPTELAKSLLKPPKRARKPRALPAACKLASLPAGNPYIVARTAAQDAAQKIAYRKAMVTGRWAG